LRRIIEVELSDADLRVVGTPFEVTVHRNRRDHRTGCALRQPQPSWAMRPRTGGQMRFSTTAVW